MPSFYLLHHKPIGDIPQHVWVAGNCLITHFLGLVLIWNKFQWQWPYVYYLVAQLLHLIPIREICQWLWSLHIFLVLNWSGTMSSENGLLHTASMHISCVLHQSGTYINEYVPIRTVLLHISWVLRWARVSIIKTRIASYKNIFCLYLWAGWGSNIPWNGDFVADNFKTTITTTFLCFLLGTH